MPGTPSGDGTYGRWLTRLTYGSLALVLAASTAVGGLADPPRDPPPVWLRGVFLLVTVLVLVLALRAFSVAVKVAGGQVVVRNVLRTHRLGCDEIDVLVMPDDAPIASSPYFRTRDGRLVKLFALSRMKNRMWGDDSATRHLAHELARELGVDVEEDVEAAKIRRFG
jgi:hypothetical protein